MRIVHVITRMIVGGAQENTLYNCLDLVRNYGDEVTLITGPTRGAEGALLEPASRSELNVVELPSLIRSIHPFHDAKGYMEIKRVLRELKPDVVHSHSAKGGMLGRAAAWSLKIPCIVHTVHGAPFHPYQNALSRRFFQFCERWAAKRCHRMICVADAMTDLMVQARVAKLEQFVTIYSGMDVDPFLKANEQRQLTRSELGIADSDIVFGKIARLFHLKGHEYVVASAQQLVRTCPNAKFLFVGDGILRESLEKQIQQLGLADRFIFTGLVAPQSIPKYIGAMDVLVHTSLREGLARAIPQALIAGKPVISFDVDGAREVVIDGVTGYLVPPKRVDLLTQAMERLYVGESLRTQMGATGSLRFTEQFRHEIMTKQIRELYVEVLNQRAS